jgi:N-acetylglucosamine-6-phosphate deacetylase
MKCIGKDTSTAATVEVAFDGLIQSIAPSVQQTSAYVAPGWIDLQVNGFAGVDYNDPRAAHEEIGRSIRALFSTGVTCFYPTVITAAAQDMLEALRNLAQAKNALAEGEAIGGFHVEGPHISREDGPRGAHPRAWVRPPDFDEFRRWQDATDHSIRIVTLAPEWPEAPRYIEQIVEQGVVAAIGHTRAEAGEIAAAVSAGATLSTHLGNGAHSMLPKLSNCIWEQLAEDRLMADFIADGVHLPASFLKAALRAKGLDRSVLITDAVAPAACPPGRYRLGQQEVNLTPDLHVVLAGQERLAGSALSMDRGLENLMKLAGLSLDEAVRMATTNAARAGKIAGRQQGLAPGDRADLVEFRYDPERARIELESTWVGGRRVYP